MASVYTGYGIDRYRAKRLSKRRAAVSASALLKISSLVILLTLALTFLMVNAAHSIDARQQLESSLARRTEVTNRINRISFEIQRETQFDNLSFKAQTRLGMIIPADSQTADSAGK